MGGVCAIPSCLLNVAQISFAAFAAASVSSPVFRSAVVKGFFRKRLRMPLKLGAISAAANRPARLRHWLEMRARGTPPKMADFGEPTSSRFRQETGKDWRMLSSMSFIGILY